MSQGRKYYRQFQPRPGNPLAMRQGSQDLWCAFQHQGIPFFMADSRTERKERKAGNANRATIMEKRQMRALKHWLTHHCDPDQPKIISTASMLLPRHLATDSDILHLDGWDGFPASLHEILAFIGENEIHKVIFLSGDEHVSSMSDIELWNSDNSRKVKVLSLHSSGFYAPFPFANAIPASLRTRDNFDIGVGSQKWHCSTETTIINHGDGYMLVKLSQEQGNWWLNLEFDGTVGITPWRCRKALL